MIKRRVFVNGGRFHQAKRDKCIEAERKKPKFPTEWGNTRMTTRIQFKTISK